jgi:hypothetical protein
MITGELVVATRIFDIFVSGRPLGKGRPRRSCKSFTPSESRPRLRPDASDRPPGLVCGRVAAAVWAPAPATLPAERPAGYDLYGLTEEETRMVEGTT